MSAFHGPSEHLAHPPATWEAHKVADHHWHLRTHDGIVLNTGYTSRHAAEEDRVTGPLASLYATESRWYAGQAIPNWKPYTPGTVDDAHAAGQIAHGLGLPPQPPRSLFSDGPVGTTNLDIVRAWTAGWTAANLRGDQ